MDSWSNFRTLIKNDIMLSGISNFRNFQTIKDTMYCSYYDIAKQFLTDDVAQQIRLDIVIEDDFYQLVNQVMNVHFFQSMCDTDVKQLKTICEFGGGCGFMCHLLKLMGFTGEYFIYDFPEVHSIQQHYLSSVSRDDNVVFITNPNDTPVDLFIGCWSISEATPRPPLTDFPAKQYWIAYQQEFDKIDNEQFFTAQFTHFDTKRALHNSNSKYLVGTI